MNIGPMTKMKVGYGIRSSNVRCMYIYIPIHKTENRHEKIQEKREEKQM